MTENVWDDEFPCETRGISLSRQGAHHSWRHLGRVFRMERLEICVKK